MTDVLKTNKPRRALRALAFVALVVASSGCQSKAVSDDAKSRGIVVVNAAAAGEVRRVLVREGVSVGEGDPIIEIVVQSEARAAPTRTEDPLARAGRSIGAAQGEVEAARAEVVRTEVEVGRLTPLVASGDAPQGQLDGARADYERAQQRFQRAQSAAQGAQSGLVAARQPQTPNSAAAPAPSEQVVTARATSAGTVSAVTARVGQSVTAGQPLATLRAGQR
ncbi:MAG: hypothetical protein LC802_15740 [Acidobacteria bacterium]|nr:hypothetical protein [Acidobacteriota bacterium]